MNDQNNISIIDDKTPRILMLLMKLYNHIFRLRKGRRQENVRASTIGTVSANLLQRKKTTRLNDMIQQYENLMIHI